MKPISGPIAIVIPILNEAESLPTLLTGIQAQTLLPQEIIFVDAGSTDASSHIIQQWWQENAWSDAQCRILSAPGGLPGAGRNKGIQAAQTEWIAFLDGGIRPEKNWLDQLYQYAQRHTASAVFGVCEFTATGIIPRAICALSYGYGAVHAVVPASLFRRELFFSKVGFFREDLRAAEDILWMRQLEKVTGPLQICAQAKVHYTFFPETFKQIAKKWYLIQRKTILGKVFQWQQLFYMVAVLITAGSWYFQPAATLILLVIYLVMRGIIDPWRRSGWNLWWHGQPKAACAAIVSAIIVDAAKVVGIFVGLGQLIFHKKE